MTPHPVTGSTLFLTTLAVRDFRTNPSLNNWLFCVQVNGLCNALVLRGKEQKMNQPSQSSVSRALLMMSTPTSSIPTWMRMTARSSSPRSATETSMKRARSGASAWSRCPGHLHRRHEGRPVAVRGQGLDRQLFQQRDARWCHRQRACPWCPHQHRGCQAPRRRVSSLWRADHPVHSSHLASVHRDRCTDAS